MAIGQIGGSGGGITEDQVNSLIDTAITNMDADKRLGLIQAGDSFPAASKNEWVEIGSDGQIDGIDVLTGEWWMCTEDNTPEATSEKWFKLKTAPSSGGGGGEWNYISTQTFTAGRGEDFVNAILDFSTYDHLKIYIHTTTTVNNNNLYAKLIKDNTEMYIKSIMTAFRETSATVEDQAYVGNGNSNTQLLIFYRNKKETRVELEIFPNISGKRIIKGHGIGIDTFVETVFLDGIIANTPDSLRFQDWDSRNFEIEIWGK